MGADRRGPLAAFVIVALIAAILLVTSVRSQAAPWFRSTVVAGPVGEPGLPVGGFARGGQGHGQHGGGVCHAVSLARWT